jgi:hypothetical protein
LLGPGAGDGVGGNKVEDTNNGAEGGLEGAEGGGEGYLSVEW